jgi:DNA polymerase-1
MQTTHADLQLSAGEMVAVAIDPSVGLGVATASGALLTVVDEPLRALVELDERFGPRWVWWDRGTPDVLVRSGVALDRCWDVLTVHRLLHGGWRTSIGEVWAWFADLPIDSLPSMGQLGLLDAATDEGDDPEQPLRPDGHLRPEWDSGAWNASPGRIASWAELALRCAERQEQELASRAHPSQAVSTARSESAAEMLCAELAHNGLPIDEAEANRIIFDAAGPRPANRIEEDAERERRDRAVLGLLQPPQHVNLRNPAEVKSMLRRTGLDLPDTRAWRLEQLQGTDPLIDALLVWRKAERIATTYGYAWLDEHVTNGRLRGDWSSSDGAAGRMTASAGLHNLPSVMRPVVAADDGYRFVRADLGQIEPRVLAAVSGDSALIAATQDPDLYQPVAERLGVSRDIAKVAVLGAMYGATTGESAGALQGLKRNYPVAMGMLEAAAADGQARTDIFTIGGRRVRMGTRQAEDGDIDKARSAAAGRGRYARNALIQGAAAEFFKVWAVLVRRRARTFSSDVVLCLHDELLVHAPAEHAEAVAELVTSTVAEAAHYWSPEPTVRFSADVSIISRWSEAKG